MSPVSWTCIKLIQIHQFMNLKAIMHPKNMSKTIKKVCNSKVSLATY